LIKKSTLIIAEKPDAAHRIALALDSDGKPCRMREKGVPYYIAERHGRIIVVPAIGHLYTVATEKGNRNRYPVFDFAWVPRYIAERNAKHVRTWIEAISKLAKEADAFIDACDYDIEGSVIGFCIMKYACENKEQNAKRMKYSILTKEELIRSYTNPLPHLDFGLIEAGLTRHEVDWLFGINLSRALTISAKKTSGKYVTISAGRVQSPTLKFAADRERIIRNFVPIPYWSLRAQVELNGQTYEAKYEKEIIETKREAEIILNDLKGKHGLIEKVDVKRLSQLPPVPFDLGTLQSEAYGLFGYNPIFTLKIAQHLYIEALISYPRTSSQKLPPTIEYPAILRKLKGIDEYRILISEILSKQALKPRQGGGEDPAHPAIYPTGDLPTRALNKSEKRIWDLVVRRFIAVFGEPAIRQSTNIDISIDNHHFYLRGENILKKGWLNSYKPYANSKECILPKLEQGKTVSVSKLVLEDKFSLPPARYDPASLLKTMERAEIGTKATRAETIQTLYDRKFVRDEKMIVTDLGSTVLEVLDEYAPSIASTKLTKELEMRMNNIRSGGGNRQEIVSDTIEILKPIIKELKENENAIGQKIGEAIHQSTLNERIMGACPVCKTGKLVIVYSQRTGKRFVGCTNYFKGLCKISFPLPQQGLVKPMARTCRRCHWPTVQIRIKGRRSWVLCVNLDCPSKKRGKKPVEMQGLS
jgi:DNA topoisomerase-1